MTFFLSKTHWHTWKLGGKMPCRRSTIPGSRMQLWTFLVDRTYQRDIKPVPALSCRCVFRYRSGERLHGMQEVTGSIPVISIPRHFTRNREVLFILSASKCITILQILCKIKVEVRRNVQDAALIIGTFAGKYLEPIKHNMHKITGICQKCLRREVGLL